MASSSLKKLPPHVVRELRRHVSPRPLKKPQEQLQELHQQQASSLKWVLGGCVTLLTTAASFPLVATWWISLNDKEEALTKSQIRRGAFNNSGSTDVGRDPDWDFSKGQYSKSAGYFAILEGEQQNKQLPAEFHAADPETLQKHDQKMRDFAQGKAKNR